MGSRLWADELIVQAIGQRLGRVKSDLVHSLSVKVEELIGLLQYKHREAKSCGAFPAGVPSSVTLDYCFVESIY